MLKHPDGLQFKLIALALAEVPLNPLYITSLTFTASSCFQTYFKSGLASHDEKLLKSRLK